MARRRQLAITIGAAILWAVLAGVAVLVIDPPWSSGIRTAVGGAIGGLGSALILAVGGRRRTR